MSRNVYKLVELLEDIKKDCREYDTCVECPYGRISKTGKYLCGVKMITDLLFYAPRTWNMIEIKKLLPPEKKEKNDI